MAISSTRYVKLIKETSFGNASTSDKNKFYLDAASFDITPPDPQSETYDGMGALANRQSTPGIYVPDGGISTAVDSENAIALIASFMGDCDVTSQNGKYLHTFVPSGDIFSLQLEVAKEEFLHSFEGGVIDELSFELADGFLQLSASAFTGKDTKGDVEDYSDIDFPNDVFTALEMTATRGGEDITDDIEDISWSMTANLPAEDRVPVGSRFLKSIPRRQDLEINVDVTFLFDDDEELQKFWGEDDGPIEKDCIPSEPMEISFHEDCSTEPGDELVFEFPRTEAEGISQDVSGRDRIEQSISFNCLHDDDSDHAVEVRVKNERSDEY